MTGVFVADLQQQFESDIEVLVVALQVLVKEWERLQIGAMPGGDLGTSMADQVQCWKVLSAPLPHAKDFRPGRGRDAGLFKDVAQVRCGADRLTFGISGELSERKNTDLEQVDGAHPSKATSAPMRAVMKSRTSWSSATLMPYARPGYTFSISEKWVGRNSRVRAIPAGAMTRSPAPRPQNTAKGSFKTKVVVMAVPGGVLKARSIKFNPPLPDACK